MKCWVPHGMRLSDFVPGYYIQYNQYVKSSYNSNAIYLTLTPHLFSLLSSLRCVAIHKIHLLLHSLPHRLCWSSPGVLCWPPVWGAVPRPGAVCSWCGDVPAWGSGGCWVPGGTGRFADQTPLSVILQVSARLPQRGAVSAHILEGSPAARSVRPLLGLVVWGTCMQVWWCIWLCLLLSIHYL